MTFWKKYSLGVTLVVLFIAALAVMTWNAWVYFVADQAQHHQVATVFGSSGYIWRWGVDTFSNWQADFLGEGLAVVFGAYLIFRGSEQSKDSSDEVENIVQDIERQVLGPQAASRAQQKTQRQVHRGGPARNYGLGIALLGAFAVSWVLMTWMGWMHYAATSRVHGSTPTVFGTSGYIWDWARLTFSNWQSDALGHGLLIVVPAYLLYKGSSQSRGGMDRVEAAVQRVQQALESRQQTQPDGTGTYIETRRRQTPPAPLSFWKKYGLGIAFLALFLVSWILQTWTGWGYFLSDQLQHHSTANVFGPSGYIWLWGQDTFSNWQSDLLWDGLIVLMGAYLIFQGSAESKDSDDRIEELAYSIEREVRGPTAAKEAEQATNRHVFDDVWHNRGLAYSLIIAGIVAWALMTWMGWMYFASTQHEHGSTATLFGTSGYIWDWGRLTLENWQSDILGDVATVILSAYLLYKGSGMSRGSDDEIEQALQRIDQTLKSKQQPAAPESTPEQSGPRRL